MKRVSRRRFVGGALATGYALTTSVIVPESVAQAPVQHPAVPVASAPPAEPGGQQTPADFCYSPVLRQTAFCFPDDPHKSLINENGELLYGYDMENGVFYFPLRFTFALYGMKEAVVVAQTLESPSIPIVRTVLQREDVIMTLTTFATNNPSEGRIDNVLVELRPRGGQPVNVVPIVKVHSVQKIELNAEAENLIVSNPKTREVLFVGKVFGNPSEGSVRGGIFDVATDIIQQLTLYRGVTSSAAPYRAFFRFPQDGQTKEKILDGLNSPEQQLQSARDFWLSWSAFRIPVAWTVPGKEGDFVAACARNILQAREVRNGKLTFQVGPTCYRGLWVVDGNFILEAARYLGHDKEAIEGLRTTWTKQQHSGQIIAGGGSEHYKDTAIAMFTVVRQCELSQDWSLLRELEPNIIAGIQFLDSLRARARAEGSALGKYGLLAKGFADGGFDGTRNEFTNTLWTMAGLKAIGTAGEQQGLPRVAKASQVYKELYSAFNQAASQEMRSYDGRFSYLPMLMKDDPAWDLPDPWDRPRPQCAQWALSHAIFPGRVFDPQHPALKGHVDLMQAVRREDVPAETGWNHHEAVWTYNAPFVAEVYLWLGMKQAAHDTFGGFLNHASPQYCWREEQPLQDALIGSYIGDMPHNWASAECIRYIRHMLALEDGAHLRLLAGITNGELAAAKPYVLNGSPTRFGRLDLNLEPLDRQQGWKLSFRRGEGPVPGSVSVPATLAEQFHFDRAEDVKTVLSGDAITLDPTSSRWSLTWKS